MVIMLILISMHLIIEFQHITVNILWSEKILESRVIRETKKWNGKLCWLMLVQYGKKCALVPVSLSGWVKKEETKQNTENLGLEISELEWWPLYHPCYPCSTELHHHFLLRIGWSKPWFSKGADYHTTCAEGNGVSAHSLRSLGSVSS